ncbi:MAG: hydroxyacid dehydrogenase [Actinobacteria bacterium]|nr:hydroxyacid dehydrogenase [Actinomycetota bacterium]
MAVLDGVVEVLDPEPVGSWADPRASSLLAAAEVVIGHWGCPPIDAAVLDRAPRLGLLAYAAGTVKDVVTDAVFDRGIRVTSGAPANAEPVAEFTLAAILWANKGVPWRRFDDRPDRTLPLVAPEPGRIGNRDKEIGIVGASLVGRRVLALLRSFPGLRPLLYDPFVTSDEAAALGAEKVELLDICARSDVLSIHAPDLPSTRGMIGRAELAALRTGATVINTARGALLDHDALADEVSAGRLYAILDTTDPEPLPPDHVLRRSPAVFATPHLAGSEGTELRRLAEHVAEEVRRWAAGGPAAFEVRRDELHRLA